MGGSQIAFSIAGKSRDLMKAYDSVRQARDVCVRIRDELLKMDVHGFTDQATTVWGAVDVMKSGDNAVLAYLDTSQPSKLSDAREHVQEASATFAVGIRQMNARRRELGIPPLRKLKLG
jgi:hypothetical protein